MPTARPRMAAEREGVAARAQAKLGLALEAAQMGEVVFNPDTGVIVHSPGFAVLLGFGPEDQLSLADVESRYHEDDRPDLLARRTALAAAGRRYEVEHRIVLPDGTSRWLAGRGEMAFDPQAGAAELRAVYMDVTERKLAEEGRALRLAQLNHRVKNTLATVQSMAMLTARNAETPMAFAQTFTARIAALAGAHDLLSRHAWEGASLEEVLDRTLDPLRGTDAGGAAKVTLNGPAVQLAPNAAITLNMAFHEMAANATQYGALSCPEGHLTVQWRIDRAAEPAVVEIQWTERDGPAVAPPTRRGFGTRLIEQGLGRELDGQVAINYEPEGLRSVIRLPVTQKVMA